MDYRPPTPFPGKGYAAKNYRGWEFKGRSDAKALDSKEREQLMGAIGARGPLLPDMIFGGNFLDIFFVASGFRMVFTVEDALKQWTTRKETGLPSSSSSSASGGGGGSSVYGDVDWTFTSEHGGRMEYDKQKLREVLRVQKMIEAPGFAKLVPSATVIPTDKLLRHDDVMFYCDSTMYMDELSDRGHSSLNIKIRVMPECFLVMQRMYVRVDGVCVRLLQWRWYHEFGHPHIIHDFEVRQGTMQDLMMASATAGGGGGGAAGGGAARGGGGDNVGDGRAGATKADTVYELLQPITVRRGIIRIEVL